MSTSVQVTSNGGAFWTWASATFKWSDADAGKTWATAQQINYNVAVSETLANGEQLGNAVTKPVAESFHIAESEKQNFGKNIAEGFTTAEALKRNFTKPIAEGFTTTESTARNVGKNFSESFTTAESLKRTISKVIAESFNTLESWSDISQFHINVAESFSVAESLKRNFTKPVSESFATSEAIGKQYTKPVSESLTTSEVFSRVVLYSRSFSEAFTTTDSLKRTFGKNVSEVFTTAEALGKNSTKAISEALHAAEVFGRTVAYHLLVAEGFTTTDAIKKATTLSKAEAFHIVEAYRRHGNAVISDMVLSTSDLALADFQKLITNGVAPGYSNFMDFTIGDYDYQKALFRVLMKSTTADRARVSDLQLIVDVPDLYDRGTATITTASSGIAVTFNRTFHAAPEVTLTLKGGTVIAIPKIVGSTTTTGFTAMLYDQTGTAVTGTFSWAAHGY